MSDQEPKRRCEYAIPYTEGKYPYIDECWIAPLLFPCWNPEDYETCSLYRKRKDTDWDKINREQAESDKRVDEALARFNKAQE